MILLNNVIVHQVSFGLLACHSGIDHQLKISIAIIMAVAKWKGGPKGKQRKYPLAK